MDANSKVLYPELSYKIVGASFKVYNGLGWGQKELYYQRALAEEFTRLGINFTREYPVKLLYNEKAVGTYILDFFIEGKVVVELKVRPRLGYTHIKQVLSYLKNVNAELAIIIYFSKEGVSYRRVLNQIP